MSKITKLINEIDLRFTSGNSVPVRRAQITPEEWQLLRACLTEGTRRVAEVNNRVLHCSNQPHHPRQS